jgi:hypothetical protein
MPNVLHLFRRKNPRAHIPEIAFPEPYICNDTENIFVDDILALLNKNGLMLHQSIDCSNGREGLSGLMRWNSGWRRGRRTE